MSSSSSIGVQHPGCVDDTINTGDTALMLMATTFVMLQTPAMGIAQAGMIRRKNALSMLMQTLTGLCIGSLLWWFIGYSLTFGSSSGGFIGSFEHIFLLDIPLNGCVEGQTIPALLFVAFQMMFALMVPVIVTGAWAEKMKYDSFLIFVTLWPIFVYYPLAHWVWGGGWLASELGTVDFAGGITIHTAAGIAGMTVAYWMARKKESATVGHHNLPLTIVGGSLIWAGWYSFNGGSALAANAQASTALMNTHLAACTSGLVWVFITHLYDGKWHVSEILNGALAGLAGVTPGSGYVEPYAAVVIGILVGCASYYTVKLIKDKLKLDDVLDVTSLQGAPGIVGSILVGFFASPEVGGETGVFYGGDGSLLLAQFVGVLMSVVWSAFWTSAIMLFIKKTVGSDVDNETEELGLDLVQIGEQGYDSLLQPTLDLGEEEIAIKLLEASARGDLAEVQRLVFAGVDPEAKDYDGRTAAHLAAAAGSLKVLQWLHNRYFINLNIVDNFEGTPLVDAIKSKQDTTAQWLVDKGAKAKSREFIFQFLQCCASGVHIDVKRYLKFGIDVDCTDYDDRTGLMLAAAEGHIKIINILLKHKASVTKTDRWNRTALDDARDFNMTDVLSVLQKGLSKTKKGKKKDSTAVKSEVFVEDELSKEQSSALLQLCKAASEGNEAEVTRLLKKSKGGKATGMDYDGRSPLHLACKAGHIKIAEILIEHGAVLNVRDRWNNTPLSEAVAENHQALVIRLKELGACVINDGAGSRLCELAFRGDQEGIGKELDTGIDINEADYDSRTALHIAACSGHLELVMWLVKKGANPNLPDRFGNTAESDAKNFKMGQIEKYLRKLKTGSDSTSSSSEEQKNKKTKKMKAEKKTKKTKK